IYINNSPADYPVAGKGLTSFLDADEVEVLYKDFTSLEVSTLSSRYPKSRTLVEYLAIRARK
ncbi:hypothetical protein, partial [Aeromonas veronii]|uniref:hypothetical protein n=1 Tax=Aeromonas veronii TaxID=654 RepID=UPI0038B52F2B